MNNEKESTVGFLSIEGDILTGNKGTPEEGQYVYKIIVTLPTGRKMPPIMSSPFPTEAAAIADLQARAEGIGAMLADVEQSGIKMTSVFQEVLDEKVMESVTTTSSFSPRDWN